MSDYGPVAHTEESKNIIEDELLSSTPVSEPIQVDGFTEVALRVKLTHATATKVSVHCEVAYPQEPAKFFRIQDNFGLSISASTGDLVFLKNVTGNDSWVWMIPSSGYRMRFVFTHVGASSDRITVSSGAFQ